MKKDLPFSQFFSKDYKVDFRFGTLLKGLPLKSRRLVRDKEVSRRIVYKLVSSLLSSFVKVLNVPSDTHERSTFWLRLWLCENPSIRSPFPFLNSIRMNQGKRSEWLIYSVKEGVYFLVCHQGGYTLFVRGIYSLYLWFLVKKDGLGVHLSSHSKKSRTESNRSLRTSEIGFKKSNTFWMCFRLYKFKTKFFFFVQTSLSCFFLIRLTSLFLNIFHYYWLDLILLILFISFRVTPFVFTSTIWTR